jgi:class 3 adenylate cyclase/CheY-like chemotaxis protein
VNHIIGYSEMLLEEIGGRVPSSFEADLQRIRSGGQQLLVLVNHYLSEEQFFGGQRDLHQLLHDLRTPVNHVIGYGELLIEQCDELGETVHKLDLNRITNAARTWLRLVEEQLVGPGSPLLAVPPPRADAAARTSLQQLEFVARPVEREHQLATEEGRLLVADDDPPNRDLLQRRLTKLGYDVTVCSDGRAAWAQLESGRFDLLLLDLLMPGIDGYELLSRVKADARLRHVPVIMMSALDRLEGIVRCIEMGAEDYLAKPFNPVLLRARVSAALEKKRLRDCEQVYLKELEAERTKSERLLLNVLPSAVAERLKQGEGTIVDSFSEVTVLFADLVGFTPLAAQLPPTQVVRLLDEVFSAFDGLVTQHGLEKIKTIGDAYMAVAGLPFARADHAERAAAAALDMLAALRAFNADHQTALEMRIGLSTGPVIAGIIGRNKFSYDLWGDTVNTASRMESHGLPGRIQVAPPTYDRLHHRYRFDDRGRIEIRGKGPMETYLLVPP